MSLDREAREEILNVIARLGSDGALITRIAPYVSCERHTLAKYLGVMELEGLVYHKAVSKAKLWFIKKASLRTAMTARGTRPTFREQTYLHIIEHLPDGVVITDERGKIIFLNDWMIAHYGGSKGNTLPRLIFRQKSSRSFEIFLRNVSKNGHRASCEILDCQRRYVRLTVSTIVDGDGNVSFVFIVSDLTAHKALEDELAEKKQLLEAERRAMNEAAIVAETDLRGNITYANDKFVSVSGYSRKELLGKTHKMVSSGYHPPAFYKNLWRTISRGKVWHGTVKNKAKDGSYYWLESAMAPVLGKNGKPSKYIAIRFDVTKYMRGA